MASAGLVAVHKSIIASLHQECVLSPFERVKTIQRISARDEERSPDIAVIGTTNRTQRIIEVVQCDLDVKQGRFNR